MRPQPSRFQPPQRTATDQRASLQSLLYQCRPQMLDQYTVDGLLRTHSKLKAREVEYLLTIARQNRAGEVR